MPLNPVRKKPCPYCGKKLQAKNKLKWRNNLARHLANACPPYERETIGFMNRIVFEMIEWVMTGRFPTREDPAAKSKDVKELQRMMALDSRALHSTDQTPTGEPKP